VAWAVPVFLTRSGKPLALGVEGASSPHDLSPKCCLCPWRRKASSCICMFSMPCHFIIYFFILAGRPLPLCLLKQGEKMRSCPFRGNPTNCFSTGMSWLRCLRRLRGGQLSYRSESLQSSPFPSGNVLLWVHIQIKAPAYYKSRSGRRTGSIGGKCAKCGGGRCRLSLHSLRWEDNQVCPLKCLTHAASDGQDMVERKRSYWKRTLF